MADENIVKMPSVLDRLATRINAYLARDATNRTEWIEIQEGICCALAEAREQFPANVEFGQWCEDNGFGEDVFDKDTRAAAITMGNDPTALYACLKATERRSLRVIYSHEFDRFRNVAKTERRKPNFENKPTPQFLKAKQAILELQAEGKEVSHKAVMERAGVSDTPVRTAMAQAKLEADLLPLNRGDMSKAQEKRFEIALQKARAEIRAELRAEVYAELDAGVLKHWKEKIERAERILDNFKGVISRDTFNLIRACLHPDHNTFARAAEAFDTFIKLEKVLVKPEPAPWPANAVPLPSTVAELMAQRRTRR